MTSIQSKGGRRIAVVVFNLGGPDRPEAVQPFLFNLFNDKSITRLPNPLRLVLANIVSRRRAKEATKIYARIGGKSPLLENTRSQAAALELALADLGTVRIFIAMRYWHPMSDEVAFAVSKFEPDDTVLLPLYPQFSTTTTASSLRVWARAAGAAGLDRPARTICCYPTEGGFIETFADAIRQAHSGALRHGRPRILFSAHGLPETIVRDGDPYQWQCEATAAALVERIAIDGLDWVSCYQSRVGPLKWIGPSTEAEIDRAGADGVPIVVAPVAFVSEHSETLVELDIEYRDRAAEKGVPYYGRVVTPGADERFIGGLATLVRQSLAAEAPICSQRPGRVCPQGWSGCLQPERSALAAE